MGGEGTVAAGYIRKQNVKMGSQATRRDTATQVSGEAAR